MGYQHNTGKHENAKLKKEFVKFHWFIFLHKCVIKEMNPQTMYLVLKLLQLTEEYHTKHTQVKYILCSFNIYLIIVMIVIIGDTAKMLPIMFS